MRKLGQPRAIHREETSGSAVWDGRVPDVSIGEVNCDTDMCEGAIVSWLGSMVISVWS